MTRANLINNYTKFYVYSSVHRWSVSIIVQRDATQSSLFIILQVDSTCFRCQPHPLSGVHKTVTTAYGTGHIFGAAASLRLGQVWRSCSASATVGGGCTKNMISTRGCSYSFAYSCRWVQLTLKTCTVNLQNNEQTASCCISMDNYYYNCTKIDWLRYYQTDSVRAT